MRRTALVVTLAALVGALVATPIAVYASHQFTDVPNTNPFHADITWLADAGITKGCSPTEYCPKDNVTREQMAAFLKRFADNQAASQTHGVAGYVTELTLGNSDSVSPKTATVTCPAGKVILGGGANIGSGTVDPPIAITSSLGFISINTGLPTWVVKAQEIGAFSGTWSVVSVIYCADPLP